MAEEQRSDCPGDRGAQLAVHFQVQSSSLGSSDWAPEQRFPEQRLGTGAAISGAAIGHVSRRPSGAELIKQ
jgi:hypothetical protein